MKVFINRYSDKISTFLICFTLLIMSTHTKYGTVSDILFGNFSGEITLGLLVVSYFLAKEKMTKYSKITLGILKSLITIFIIISIFAIISTMYV